MFVTRALAAALIAATSLAGVSMAAAADKAFDACRFQKPALAIPACTAVLARGAKEPSANRAIAFYNRGNAFFNQGNLAKAIEDYTRSIAINSDFADVHFNRGNGYFNTGDLGQAIADYGEVLRIDPGYVNAYVNRGNAYRKQYDFAAALADYAAALKLDPANGLAQANRAQALADKGDAERAIALADKGAISQAELVKRAGPAAAAAVAAKTKTPEPPKPAPPEAVEAKSASPEVVEAEPALPEVVEAKPAPLGVVKAKPAAPAETAQPPTIAVAEIRIALVIGNSGYSAVAKLPNPQRDAEAVAEALKRDGFRDVMLGSDLSRADLVQALNDFADKAAKADWAVVYFAGHGLELDGVNYLVPVDARLKSDRDVQDEAVSLDRVVASVEGARKLKLVILDACRNNPFVTDMRLTVASRAIHRGLARVEPSGATLVAYAAKGGEEAVDGDGTANSPFAAALVKRLATPGLEVGKLFRLVRDDVLAATGKKQEPFVYGSLPGEDFFFRPQ